MPESNASKSGRERVFQLAQREDLSILALARRICGYQGLEMMGTASEVVDTMQRWLESGAADGFNVMFSHFPSGAEEFFTQVIPVLQRRGCLESSTPGDIWG